MCAITHIGHLPEILVSVLLNGLEHELDDARILEEHFHFPRLYQSCYLSDTKYRMCHGLPGTIRECPVIGRRGYDCWAGQRSRSESECADVSHFGQLTREICPRLVTDATMCPRSSAHMRRTYQFARLP